MAYNDSLLLQSIPLSMRREKENCIWEWKEINDVSGYEIRGSKGHIFIPAGGYVTGVRHRNARSIGLFYCQFLISTLPSVPCAIAHGR